MSIQDKNLSDKKIWNKFDNPRPYVSVMGFAYDKNGDFPVLHRSKKVRSAKNAWSLPSGLHEVGLTIPEQLTVEMKEELNIDCDPSTAQVIGVYENITNEDPAWHWVIILLALRARGLKKMINREPEKHDKIVICNFSEILTQRFLNTKWTPGLGPALYEHSLTAYQTIRANVVK